MPCQNYSNNLLTGLVASALDPLHCIFHTAAMMNRLKYKPYLLKIVQCLSKSLRIKASPHQGLTLSGSQLPSSSITFYLAHPVSATQATLLFLEHSKHTTTSGPFYLFSLPSVPFN